MLRLLRLCLLTTTPAGHRQIVKFDLAGRELLSSMLGDLLVE
ncbi:MAG: hypothetical protein R3B90_03280 [Planctomycetaceae bacterium]